jgi:putative endopeptidase
MLLVGSLVGLLSCGPKGRTDPVGPGGGGTGGGGGAGGGGPVGTPVSLEDVGLSAAALDRSVDPCQDFYRFACGGWLAATEIPADQPRWSRSFSEINKRNEEDMHRLLAEAAASTADDPRTRTMGAFFAACMDEPAIEQAGLSGVEPLLARARAIKSWKDVGPTIIELHTFGIFPAFGVDIDQDFKDPNQITTYLEQGGLGLPDRDYYLEDRFKEQRDFYAGHVERMLALSGMAPKQAAAAAVDIVWLETELAKVSKTKVEMRDLPNVYNKIDRDGVAKTVKNIDWNAYFAAQGVPDVKHISVSGLRFFEALNGLVKRGTPKQWSHYLQWTILRSAASTLPKAYVDEQFALRQKLTGQKEDKPRWKKCVAATDGALREYTGRAFVELRFSAESKAAVTAMIHGISDAFGAAVQGYDWMDDATRAAAAEKRSKMAYLIGYPDEWKDYDFALDPKAYTANWLAAARHEQRLQWQKTRQPVNRKDWSWSAAIVNAFYHPLRNNMNFPAGILQPPFYSPDANVAVNLGALGMVVGHELTHGFDDKGSLFDADGAMRNWWSPAVGEKFGAKKQCVIDQYNGYEPLPGVHVNGELTLGENIADLGGVKMAFHAYRALRKDTADPVVADGFSEDQQFFLAVGQTWCTESTEEMTRMLIQVDTHSPSEFRVRGALANLPEFAEAFQCAAGTPYNPDDACTVW